MHHMTEHYLFCFYREITCFCSSMIYQNIQLLIFILAMFLAIIIDYTDNNNPDDTNFLIKNIEKMKRSCSKLFSNYCTKTNPGTPTNEIYQNQWMQNKCSPCFQSVSIESKLTFQKKKKNETLIKFQEKSMLWLEFNFIIPFKVETKDYIYVQ